MKNKKLLLLVTVALAFVVSGCSAIRFPGTPENQPKQKFHHSEKMTTEPKVIEVLDADGKVMKVQIGEVTSRSYDVALETVIPKKSFVRRVWDLFGWWVIALVIFGVFVPGGGAILSMVFKRASNVLGKGFKQTTKGVEEFLKDANVDDDAKKKLLASLSNNMDEETKETVSKLKRTT